MKTTDLIVGLRFRVNVNTALSSGTKLKIGDDIILRKINDDGTVLYSINKSRTIDTMLAEELVDLVNKNIVELR